MPDFKTAQEKDKMSWLSVYIKPLLISLSLTLILLSILALAICYGPFSESIVGFWVPVVTAIGLFLSGFLSARKKTRGGLLSGVIGGIGYFLTSYLMAVFSFGSVTPNDNMIKQLFLAVAIGAIGGIIGINTKHNKR